MRAWAGIYKYYREISGQGLLNKELEIMQPTKAKKDTEVTQLIEKWEDEYKECLKLGMREKDESTKITILRLIATKDLRDELDKKIYSTYEEATGYTRRPGTMMTLWEEPKL